VKCAERLKEEMVEGLIFGRSVHKILGIEGDFIGWARGVIAELGMKRGIDYEPVGTVDDDGVEVDDIMLTEFAAKRMCFTDIGQVGSEYRDHLFNCARDCWDAGKIRSEDIPPPIRMIIEAEDRGYTHIDARSLAGAMPPPQYATDVGPPHRGPTH
jgi:hypothetical protein